MSLEVGTSAPDFTLRNQRREKISLEDLKGERSVIVFIPYAFTSTCQGELCEIRDNLHRFNDAGVRVVAITCNTLHSNGVWAEQQGYTFDILSDFWPHGAVSRAFDTFDETFGYAKRTTYFLDDQAVITDVVKSDELGVARPFGEYERILS
ncbi:MAG: redoxin domain-containing protein [Actinobacteria bacterium]|nr:redoxin domain-containing protein [Actinomycetota bacterium]